MAVVQGEVMANININMGPAFSKAGEWARASYRGRRPRGPGRHHLRRCRPRRHPGRKRGVEALSSVELGLEGVAAGAPAKAARVVTKIISPRRAKGRDHNDISSTEAHIGPYEIFWRILVAEIERC